MNSLKNITLFITGGTGSFGSRFIKMLLDTTDIGFIRSYSRDEHKNQELRERFGIGRFDTRLGDIRDKDRLKRALIGVDWVVHAAALKQAPLSELEPLEFVKTNVYGTQNLVEVCLDSDKVSQMILISTDKAVKPINLYGATKMLAERIVINAENLKGRKNIAFACTRYGNVAGSRSTIVPILLSLDKTKEVPITNKLATRFWIGLKAANNFVLNSLFRMKGGEIFIPRIPSVHVTDIAEALCPGRPHKIIGDRPGDKIHEILIAEHEKYNSYLEYYEICKTGKYTGIEYNSENNEFLSVEQIRQSIPEYLNESISPKEWPLETLRLQR